MQSHSRPSSPRNRWTAVLVRGIVLAVAAGALVGFHHETPADRTQPVAATANQVSVPAAPMGWASWNSFASQIDSNLIKAQADALVTSGMAAAGYKYVNIDEGWWTGTRDGNGNITTDTTKWPGGMKAIADYIHGKGLKAGIYTDAGKNGCGYYFPTPSSTPAYPNTGSEGHYAQDMLQFSQWGFDFVKVDWCGGDAEQLDARNTYQAISNAVAQSSATTGRPLTLSICNWGRQNPWNWAPGTAPMWRTSNDIILFGNTPSWTNMVGNFDQTLHPSAQHTGYYNDPDMLMVGMNGFTSAQNRTHMSLWAISGAPLIAGNDLTKMSADTAGILTNPELIAVDQDPRGLQGVKVAEDSTGLQVYSKVLSGSGKRAVMLLNRTSSAQNITVRWADLGLTTAAATVHDVWSHSDLGTFATGYTTSVPAKDSVLLTAGGTEAAGSTYEAESAANTLNGTAATAACSGCSGGTKVGNVGTGSANSLRFNGVTAGATGVKVVDIAYVNGDSTARTAQLQVDGQTPTTLSFPPTGSWTTPAIASVEVTLARGSSNTLAFSNASAWAPDFDAIKVSDLPGTNGNEVVSGQSGRCLDVDNGTITNGRQAQIWDCNAGANQAWTYTSRKELVLYGDKCLDAYNAGTTNGTKAVIWDCNGGGNQKWNVNGDGTVTNVNAGLCLDVSNAATVNGSLIDLWSCNGGGNQKWTLT